jgi:hypothetical protein
MNAKLKEFNHVDLLFPSKYLKAADLRGKDVTVTIRDIDPRGELQMRNGAKEHKPIVTFNGTEKLWVMNKTNAQSIAKVYGPEIMQWIGKRVTLYPTRVQCGRNEVDAIRVRERAPNAKAARIEDEPACDAVTGEVASSLDGASMRYLDEQAAVAAQEMAADE